MMIWASLVATSAIAIQDLEFLPEDEFFNNLVLGGVFDGQPILEVPISSGIYGAPSLQGEWEYVWSLKPEQHDRRSRRDSSFFSQVISNPQTPLADEDFFYWGGRIDQDAIDLEFVQQSTDFQVGDSLPGRSKQGSMSIQVESHEVVCNRMEGYCLVVALGSTDWRLEKDSFLIAGSELRTCVGPCDVSTAGPSADTKSQIKERVSSIIRLEEQPTIDRLVVMTGHFTGGASVEYVVFIDIAGGRHPLGEWWTVVLSEDLSLISILGNDSYLSMIPSGVSDIDGNGTDEIWVHLEGLEGSSDGIIYWRGADQDRKFGLIKTALNGM